jgi:hypothetical protein
MKQKFCLTDCTSRVRLEYLLTSSGGWRLLTTLIGVGASQERTIKIMRTRVLGFSLILLFLAGPSVATNNRYATVYVYRPAQLTAMARRPSIYVDRMEIARLHDGTYLKFEVAPGQHLITSARYVKGRPSLNFEPGREYFFEVKGRFANAVIGGGAMKLRGVPQQQAVKEMERLREVDLNQPKFPKP